MDAMYNIVEHFEDGLANEKDAQQAEGEVITIEVGCRRAYIEIPDVDLIYVDFDHYVCPFCDQKGVNCLAIQYRGMSFVSTNMVKQNREQRVKINKPYDGTEAPASPKAKRNLVYYIVASFEGQGEKFDIPECLHYAVQYTYNDGSSLKKKVYHGVNNCRGNWLALLKSKLSHYDVLYGKNVSTERSEGADFFYNKDKVDYRSFDKFRTTFSEVSKMSDQLEDDDDDGELEEVLTDDDDDEEEGLLQCSSSEDSLSDIYGSCEYDNDNKVIHFKGSNNVIWIAGEGNIIKKRHGHHRCYTL
eukprot:TRINITY_DN677_c1_g1_i5.p1 TRINITY_DN677_c1_g1~~TRINITY_DN677_c1_g1_i5.p1  ORF type:complete len:301 (-),score=98.61 TRINITY_DN677_c1_g1_i5:53-955(-)